jgi:hypothetical protein
VRHVAVLAHRILTHPILGHAVLVDHLLAAFIAALLPFEAPCLAMQSFIICSCLLIGSFAISSANAAPLESSTPLQRIAANHFFIAISVKRFPGLLIALTGPLITRERAMSSRCNARDFCNEGSVRNCERF